MAFHNLSAPVSEPVDFSRPHGTFQSEGAGFVKHKDSRTRQTDVEPSDRCSGSPQTPSWNTRYGRLIAGLTVAAFIIGSLKGGWQYAAILAAITLGECIAVIFAVISHDQRVANAR